MPTILNKREAIAYTKLDEKMFNNFFSVANEFDCQKRVNDRGRFYFDKEILENWLKERKWRTVDLTIEDYAQCLDFALAQHFRGYVLSDWGTGRQREFGQKISNWVKGQLGEVAVKKFLKQNFNIDVELDFDIRENIVPQDIVGINDGKQVRLPKTNIAIKSSKPKSAYLVLSENEILHDDRKSDVYILCRPDLPDDHLLRIAKKPVIDLIKGQKYFPKYKDAIPSFENIQCEISGYAFTLNNQDLRNTS